MNLTKTNKTVVLFCHIEQNIIAVNMSKVVGSTVLKLNNGFTIPVLGLGTWTGKPGDVKAAIETAIDVGYKHIDCSPVYQNEDEVGQGLKTKIDEVSLR